MGKLAFLVGISVAVISFNTEGYFFGESGSGSGSGGEQDIFDKENDNDPVDEGDNGGSMTFYVTTDPQYDNGNTERNRASTLLLEQLTNTLLKSDNRTRGVIIAGDLTQNARLYDEFHWYRESTKKITASAYDAPGNHDAHPATFWQNLACYFQTNACVSSKNIISYLRSTKQDQSLCLHSEGAVYSWVWSGILFVQLGIYPGNRPYIDSWASYVDPETSLSFLKNLLFSLKDKTIPIVFIMHYAIDADVGAHSAWSQQQLINFWEALEGYNPVIIFSGHVHARCYRGLLSQVRRPTGVRYGPSRIAMVLGGAAHHKVFTKVTVLGNEFIMERFCDGKDTPSSNRRLSFKRSATQINDTDYLKERTFCTEPEAYKDYFPWGWLITSATVVTTSAMTALLLCLRIKKAHSNRLATAA